MPITRALAYLERLAAWRFAISPAHSQKTGPRYLGVDSSLGSKLRVVD
ncbi:hypothetical protein HMPREF0578_0623 [Mobiluncus mulieris 28-1]|nr:hypothetical protein HMPREF0578_0623 [Mobiluncus mulieris 28-1]